MAGPAAILAGLALVLAAVVVALGVHSYRTLPEVYPRDESPLGATAYEAVRAGLVFGGVLGATGGVLAVVDTLGTIAAAGPGDGGTVGDVAAAIPEWAASTTPLVGGVLVAAAALALLVAGVGDWLGE